MSRPSRVTPQQIAEMKSLYASGLSRKRISEILLEQGIVMNPTTIYYHLGLKKTKKGGVKRYLDYVRDDCTRRGVPYRNPRSRDLNLWS